MTAAPLSSAINGYHPGGDLRWLLQRPWLLLSRLLTVLWQLTSLSLVLLVQGSSTDEGVPMGL